MPTDPYLLIALKPQKKSTRQWISLGGDFFGRAISRRMAANAKKAGTGFVTL
jgi:hypothetical protein